VRFDGNDDGLTDLAKTNALTLGAGHSFIVFMDGVYPIAVLNAIKAVPEVGPGEACQQDVRGLGVEAQACPRA
jgi:adenosine/AMP kinase